MAGSCPASMLISWLSREACSGQAKVRNYRNTVLSCWQTVTTLRPVDGISWVETFKGQVFATTRWSVVKASTSVNEAQAREALGELCRTYWLPVYACIRHQDYSEHDAEDLTQDFFLRLLDGRRLKYLDQAKGRFRAYLSVALQHFLRSRWRHRWALRRKDGAMTIPLDLQGAEARYQRAVITPISPALLYERQWARTIIDGALDQLKTEMRADDKEMLFEHFEAAWGGDADTFSPTEAARRLGLSAGALHALLHRWRRRLRSLLREEVARTVYSKEEIEEELRHLLVAFAT